MGIAESVRSVLEPAVRSGGASVLPRSEPESLGLDRARLERLYEVIGGHIAAGRYPGAQIAIARLEDPWHGRRLDQVSSLVHSALVEL